MQLFIGRKLAAAALVVIVLALVAFLIGGEREMQLTLIAEGGASSWSPSFGSSSPSTSWSGSSRPGTTSAMKQAGKQQSSWASNSRNQKPAQRAGFFISPSYFVVSDVSISTIESWFAFLLSTTISHWPSPTWPTCHSLFVLSAFVHSMPPIVVVPVTVKA
jgi:hypothetical protein